ncbi:hypothetical protein, partial [Salmonella sp. SAL4448]|uniref:hypothetical protein n=1 Tax=Salmonella sp. SAL4448 TaxID=3159903 RepID=UPI0039795E8B
PMSRPARPLVFVLCFMAFSLLSPQAAVEQTAAPDPPFAVDPRNYQDLRWRNVGPSRGGRVTAVAGVRSQPCTYYMGATGGGVWK